MELITTTSPSFSSKYYIYAFVKYEVVEMRTFYTLDDVKIWFEYFRDPAPNIHYIMEKVTTSRNIFNITNAHDSKA